VGVGATEHLTSHNQISVRSGPDEINAYDSHDSYQRGKLLTFDISFCRYAGMFSGARRTTGFERIGAVCRQLGAAQVARESVA